MSQSTLDTFVGSKAPIPDPVFTSEEIEDRKSVFVASIYRVTTPQEARQRTQHMKRVVHSAKPAAHEMSAWRCMVLKPGHTGLAGPEDFILQSGYNDDGERWGGERILKVMDRLGILDAVIIVTRWCVIGQIRVRNLSAHKLIGTGESFLALRDSLISRLARPRWPRSSKTGKNSPS